MVQRTTAQTTNNDEIQVDHNLCGIDRRGSLKGMAWAGAGVLCVLQGGS